MGLVLLGFSAVPLTVAVVLTGGVYPERRDRAVIDINATGRKWRFSAGAATLPNRGATKARLAATALVWLNAAMTRRQAGKQWELR